MSITRALQDHHKHCDDEFATAEEAAQRGDWARCETAFASLRLDITRHFRTEEEVLFPAFEAHTGMTSGPTHMMRHEHMQMRALLDRLDSALVSKNADDFAGEAETLLVLMQQHNMKEENILYPMCDQALGRDADVGARIEQGLRA